MNAARKIRNVLRGLLQMHAPSTFKARLWDAEFSDGRWDCLDDTAGDVVYACVEALARGGRILDLGCGSGTTAMELEEGSYREFVGVDISEVAIQKARRRAERRGLAGCTRFTRGDISTYQPDGQFDVVLFRDSIYYVPHANIVAMLERYARHLRPSGAIVVRLANADEKYGAIVSAIERRFDVVDKCVSETPSAVVIAFRGDPAGISG